MIPVLVLWGIAALLTAAFFACIYWNDIVNWFRERSRIKASDRQNIAFTLKKKMSDGDFTVVQGIFNDRTEQIVEGRKMVSSKIDPELESAHGGRELAIYQ